MNYKIKIPDGCKVMNVEVTNNRIILEVEKEEPKFKENDVIACVDGCYKWIAIYKDEINETSFNAKVIYNIQNEMLEKNSWAVYANSSLATDSEKQLLFDKLKEKCLMFDGENIVRWRAGIGGHYYCISSSRVDTRAEQHFFSDNENYNIGNYFPTKELAESFKKQYLELFNNFHKNL